MAFHLSSILFLWLFSSKPFLRRLFFFSIRYGNTLLKVFFVNSSIKLQVRVTITVVKLSPSLRSGSSPICWSLRLLTESELLLFSIWILIELHKSNELECLCSAKANIDVTSYFLYYYCCYHYNYYCIFS